MYEMNHIKTVSVRRLLINPEFWFTINLTRKKVMFFVLNNFLPFLQTSKYFFHFSCILQIKLCKTGN